MSLFKLTKLILSQPGELVFLSYFVYFYVLDGFGVEFVVPLWIITIPNIIRQIVAEANEAKYW